MMMMMMSLYIRPRYLQLGQEFLWRALPLYSIGLCP